jgi:hypothetical protein
MKNDTIIKWVSVSKKLPQEGVEIIFFTIGENYHLGYFDEGYFHPNDEIYFTKSEVEYWGYLK